MCSSQVVKFLELRTHELTIVATFNSNLNDHQKLKTHVIEKESLLSVSDINIQTKETIQQGSSLLLIELLSTFSVACQKQVPQPEAQPQRRRERQTSQGKQASQESLYQP